MMVSLKSLTTDTLLYIFPNVVYSGPNGSQKMSLWALIHPNPTFWAHNKPSVRSDVYPFWRYSVRGPDPPLVSSIPKIWSKPSFSPSPFPNNFFLMEGGKGGWSRRSEYTMLYFQENYHHPCQPHAPYSISLIIKCFKKLS